MKPKRSLISRERQHELQQHNRVYVVSCGLDGCPCENVTPGCERGFFSLFLQAVYGIDFAYRNRLPYHINYGNCQYLYSDQAQESRNFWNYYFVQPLPLLPEGRLMVSNLFQEVFPLRIWDRQHFIHLNRTVISNLQFTDAVQQWLERYMPVFRGQKVMGIQIRGTDHKEEVLPVSQERILKEIDRRIKGYDKLFVATDDHNVIMLLKSRYGDKVFCFEAERSANEEAVHLNRQIKDRYRLGLEVLLDCYCLSLCNYALLMHSNISYAALLFNPQLPYALLERFPEKQKRMKTLLLYYLDKLGIRKW